MHPKSLASVHPAQGRGQGSVDASLWTAPLVRLAEKHQLLYVLCHEPSDHMLQWLNPELLPHIHKEFAALEAPEFWGEYRWHFANPLYAVSTYAQLHAISRWLFLSAADIEQTLARLRGKHLRCDPLHGVSDPAVEAALDGIFSRVCAPLHRAGL